MPAAAPGTTVIAVPGPDGANIVVTLNHNPDTGEFNQPWAITVDGAPANIHLHATGSAHPTLFTCIPGAHITAGMLADAGIRIAADIHAVTVTAA